MAIIGCEGCHIGLLGSLDSMDEALSQFPLPKGETRGERDIERLSYGVCGRLFTSSRGFISIKTDPNEAGLVVIVEKLRLVGEYKARIRDFLDKFFGAKEISMS
jgi:hypothetical protein